MTSPTQLEVSDFLLLKQTLTLLAADGWTISDSAQHVHLSGEIKIPPTKWHIDAALVPFVTFMEATGSRRGNNIVLQVVNGSWEIFTLPPMRPDQLFEAEELDFANRLWQSETSAVENLTLEWRIEVNLDLSLRDGADQGLQVNWSAAHVDTLFDLPELRALSRLLLPNERRTFLALEGEAAAVVFGSVTLTTLKWALANGLEAAPVTPRLPGESNSRLGWTASDVMFVTGDEVAWPNASRTMRTATCIAIWSSAATSFTDRYVEFFGYKRVRFDLPREWTPAQLEGALRLRLWLLTDVGPDRALAFNQIVSLYSDPPFDFVEEIVLSADTIYLGLRSEATAEAMRATREAEEHARQAVRLSAQSSVDLAKAAGERLLAGLVAVGAAALANVTRVLDAGVTTAILCFIAVFFAVVLTMFLLIDRRAVGLPLQQLGNELSRRRTYLSPLVTNEIASSPELVGARQLVRITRIAIISLYSLILFALLLAVYLRTR